MLRGGAASGLALVRRRWVAFLLAGVAVLGGGVAVACRPWSTFYASLALDRGQPTPAPGGYGSPLPVDLGLEQLWELRVRPYLELDLWQEDLAYDAGQTLQVPLHAAFALGRREWIDQFARHFARFLASDSGTVPAASPLNRLQYLYLASRFAVLCGDAGRLDLIPAGLVDRLSVQLDRLWFHEPAWMWGRDPFRGGMAERIRWKLNAKKVRKTYHRAIIDQEFQLMAIAGDLWHLHRVRAIRLLTEAAVTDALNLSFLVFQQRVVPSGSGGWLLQPGVWRDHPDMAFAGTERWSRGAAPRRVAGVAEDSSHSHRYPLWLTSLLAAYPAGSPQREFYATLRAGLANQLLDTVLVPPGDGFPSYRTTNYMDGRNGWYRVGHRTLVTGRGYRPYELSGSFLLGWWSFLDHPKVCQAYRRQAALFPLPDRVIRVYVGPGTSRYQNAIVSIHNGYRNGHRQLLTGLAAARCTASVR